MVIASKSVVVAICLGLWPATAAMAADVPALWFDSLAVCVTSVDKSATALQTLLDWRVEKSDLPGKSTIAAGAMRRSIVTDPRGLRLELVEAAEGKGCASPGYLALNFVPDKAAATTTRIDASDPGQPHEPSARPKGYEQHSTKGIIWSLSNGTGPRPAWPGQHDLSVDRIAIIVRDADASADALQRELGLRRHADEIVLDGASNSRSGGIKAVFLDANGVWLALVQPVGPGPLQDLLDRKGDGWIAELIVEAADIDAFYTRMQARGITLVDTRGAPLDDLHKAHVLEPFGDKIAYLPESATGGLVIEFVERGPASTSLMHRRDLGWKFLGQGQKP